MEDVRDDSAIDASSAPGETDRSLGSDIDSTLAETERWFVRQGLPHFIDDYTATEKVLPRAIPVLTLSFLASVTVTVNQEWPLWRNVFAVAAAFLVLVVIWVVANRARGQPGLRAPETVGPVEVGVYVFGPAVLNILVGNPRAAGLVILGNVAQLVFIFYSTSYGLVPLTVWNVRLVVEQIDSARRLISRTFPILLVAVTFLLFNGAVWQSITRIPLPRYFLVLALFLGMTLLFAYGAVTAEFETLSLPELPDEVRDLCTGSPVGQAAASTDIHSSQVPPLTGRERLNVLAMATYGIFGYVLVVTLVMLAFFVLFGLLTIPLDVVGDLTGAPVEPLSTIAFFRAPISLTRELLRISGFVAVFSSLYFAVHAVTDQTFRQELDGSIKARVREALAVRAVYYSLLNHQRDSEPE